MFNLPMSFMRTRSSSSLSSLKKISSNKLILTNSNKSFADMAKFDYLDPLRLNSLLTEEERMVRKYLSYRDLKRF